MPLFKKTDQQVTNEDNSIVAGAGASVIKGDQHIENTYNTETNILGSSESSVSPAMIEQQEVPSNGSGIFSILTDNLGFVILGVGLLTILVASGRIKR